MKNNKGCLLNTFFILGLLALILVVTYRVAFYADYLYLDNNEAVFSGIGGERVIKVQTDSRAER